MVLLVEEGIDGADIEVGAGSGRPILYFVDLHVQRSLQVNQGDLGFIGPKIYDGLLFVVAGQIVVGNSCKFVHLDTGAIDCEFVGDYFLGLLEVLEGL